LKVGVKDTPDVAAKGRVAPNAGRRDVGIAPAGGVLVIS
jgi:hypothetical protein